MPRRLKLLVLTEDTAKHGWQTVKEVVKKTLEFSEPNAQLWREESDEHEWIDPKNNDDLKKFGANFWRSTKREDVEPIRALKRAIVTRLLEHDVFNGKSLPVGFVFFHHDGDARWSDHPKCTLCGQFQKFVTALRAAVYATVERDTRVASDKRQAAVDAAMTRMLAMEPHWCIEAWLYGKSDKAREFCKKLPAHDHADAPPYWALNRKDIEEEAMPKQGCCFHDKHNWELARAFRASDANGDSPSFTALVEGVLACDDLLSALTDVGNATTGGTPSPAT